MKKKVIITLLTATATGVAFANVNVNDQIGDWNFTGVPGEGSEIGKLNVLVPNLAGGEASQTISNLPRGKYILSWDDTTAKNVVVKANGVAIDNGGTFELSEGEALTITIGPADDSVNNGGYTIESITLEINCNPVEFRATLLAAIEAASQSFTSLNENVIDETVIADFADRKEAIEAEISALKAKAELIPNTDDVSIDEYKDLELWDLDPETNKLYTGEAGLNAIEDEITTYNGDADLVNAKADFVAKAKAAAGEAENTLSSLDTTNLSSLLESITENAQAEWINSQIEEQYNALKEEQEKLPIQIETLGATNCDNAATLEAVAEADTALDAQIAEVREAVAQYADAIPLLEIAINNAINTANNYNNIYVEKGSAEVPSVNYLNEVVDNARKQLFQLGGAYTPLQQQANEKIDEILETTLAGLDIKEGEIDNANDENYSHDQSLLNQAIQDIKAAVDNALAEDNPYRLVAEKIQALTETISSTEGTRPSDAADLADELANINGQIDTLEEKAFEALTNGSIREDSFDSEINEIKTLIDAYNDNVAASIQDVENHNTNNVLLNGYLSGEDGLITVWNGWLDTEKTEMSDHKDWWITSNAQFAESYNNLKTYIEAQIAENDRIFNSTTEDITIIETGTGSAATIEASVSGFTSTGNLIINEILSVASDVKVYGSYVVDIQTILNNKVAYVENVKVEYNATLSNITATLNGMANALSDAVSKQASGQAIYEAVLVVKATYADANFLGKLNQVLTALEQGICDSNKNYINETLEEYKKNLPEGDDIPGKAEVLEQIDDLDTSDIIIPTNAADITTDEETDETNINEYADIFKETDEAIAKAYAELLAVKAAIDAIWENEANYQALVDLSVDLSLKLTGYVEVIEAHIEAGSVDAPTLAKQMSTILTQLYSYNGTIYEAYQNFFKEEGFTYADVQTKINGWADEANQIMAALSNDVINYNNTLFNVAWENNTENGYKSVYNTYIASVKDFDEYKSVTNTGFLEFIYNGKTVSKILEENHGSLFAYYDLIRQLNNDAIALLNKLNGTYVEADGDDYAHVGVTITDQFDPGTTIVTESETNEAGVTTTRIVSGFLTLSAQYKIEIEQVLNTFATEMNAAAEAYYAQLSAEKETLLSNALTNMVSAGIEEATAKSALLTLQSNFIKASDIYDTVMSEEEHALAKSIDIICSNLDTITEASVAAVTEPAAYADWQKAYSEAITLATVSFPEGSESGINKEVYNELFNKLAELNAEAEKDYANQELLVNLVDLKARLTAAAESAKAEGESIINAWNTQHANQVLWESFLTEGIASLNEMYNALSDFVLPLACAPDEINALSIIKNEIVTLEYMVKTYGAANISWTLGIDSKAESYEDSSKYQDIVSLINHEYVNAYNNAIAFLKSNVDEVQASFNSALAADKLIDVNVDELWDEINALSDKIYALADVTTAEEAQKGIVYVSDLQNQLAGYQVQLDAYNGIDQVGQVVETLTQSANNVQDQITEIQLYLNTCVTSVQEQYIVQIEGLQTELEAIIAKINAADPTIIYQQTNLKYQLNSITIKISTLHREIVKAEDAAQAQIALEKQNQAIYDELMPKVDAISTANELLLQESEFFGYSASWMIDWAQSWVESANSLIEDQYKNTQLPSFVENNPRYEEYLINVSNRVNLCRQENAYSMTTDMYNNATNWVKRTADKVQYYDEKYPAQSGKFESELAELVSTLAVIGNVPNYDYIYPISTDTATTYVDQLKSIFEQSEQVLENAKALYYLVELNDVILGDVTGDNNVNIADVVKLLNLVLSDIEYDETNRNHIAADINGNHRLDTSDIQSILNIIYGSEAKATTMQRMTPKAANISVASERLAIADGAQRFAINMSNDTKLVGGMVDIVVSEGMEITSILPTERLQGIEFYTNDLGNGVTRVVFINTTETNTISGSDGALFTVEVSGSGNISLDNVEFTNAQAHLYTIGAASTPSGIESIWSDVKAFGRRIYNVSGQMMNRLQRGLNIITNSDGTTTKILKK